MIERLLCGRDTSNAIMTLLRFGLLLAIPVLAVSPLWGDAASDRAKANLHRPIVLGADDHRAVPDAPVGFDQPRAGIPHGRVELLEWDSRTVGTRRRASVYLPPNYSAATSYPTLYLLHGIDGDETEWLHFAHPDVILDNLIAEGRAQPMIVVLPNGRAMKNDARGGNPFTAEKVAAFAHFEPDLLDDLIPAVEGKYPVIRDRQHRALAGLSMGGGQTLNFGLHHLDRFAWLGAFSPAPNTLPPSEVIPDASAARVELRLFWLSCGSHDGLINISQGVHSRLKELGVPHVWNVDDHAHESAEWANNFYHFAQRVFN